MYLQEWSVEGTHGTSTVMHSDRGALLPAACCLLPAWSASGTDVVFCAVAASFHL
jgi:hypothetical protein